MSSSTAAAAARSEAPLLRRRGSFVKMNRSPTTFEMALARPGLLRQRSGVAHDKISVGVGDTVYLVSVRANCGLTQILLGKSVLAGRIIAASAFNRSEV